MSIYPPPPEFFSMFCKFLQGDQDAGMTPRCSRANEQGRKALTQWRHWTLTLVSTASSLPPPASIQHFAATSWASCHLRRWLVASLSLKRNKCWRNVSKGMPLDRHIHSSISRTPCHSKRATLRWCSHNGIAHEEAYPPPPLHHLPLLMMTAG